MKITKRQLKRIIKEEKARLMTERRRDLPRLRQVLMDNYEMLYDEMTLKLRDDELYDVEEKVAQIIVDEFDQCFAQVRDINGTGFHDLHGVGFVEQGQQQMFERCKFVAAGVCQREGRVDCLLKCSRE